MAIEPSRPDQDILEPEDSAVVSASPSTPEGATSADPADEIPVPVAMSPAEIDERAQAVEAVRGTRPTEPEARA